MVKKYIKQIMIGFFAGIINRFFFNWWWSYFSAGVYVFIKNGFSKI